PESYVHRIGRTGRAGRTGEAISFITPREIGHLKLIEKVTKSKMKRMSPQTNKDARVGQQQIAVTNILKTIKENDLSTYQDSVNKLLEENESITVVAAGLKLLTKEREQSTVHISSIQPVSVKGGGYRGKGKDNRSRGGGNKRYYGKRKQNNRR